MAGPRGAGMGGGRSRRTLGGMSLGEFKAATEPVVAERANLKRLRGDVRGTIARRNTADHGAKKIINRVIVGVKASPNFGPDSDLYRQLAYVPRIRSQLLVLLARAVNYPVA